MVRSDCCGPVAAGAVIKAAGAVVLIAGCAMFTAPARAGLTQASIVSPGGFVQAGATDAESLVGGGIIPGGDLQIQFGALGADFNEQSFSGLGSATASASFSIPSITNSASGTVSLGQVKLYADNSNDTLSGAFPGGRSHGGYKDTLTVSSPGLNGQPGFFVFTMNVNGTLSATGANGSANVLTDVYKDGFDLNKNAFWDQGNSDLIATDRQRAFWGVSTFAVGESVTKPIADTITMSVPIIFGTQFELGFYVYAVGSTRSAASAAGGSTAVTAFQNSFDYGGVSAVYVGSDPHPVNDLVSNFSIGSASGTDWGVAVPEPATAWLMLFGLGCVTLRRNCKFSRLRK
jgi:hypothetical protein